MHLLFNCTILKAYFGEAENEQKITCLLNWLLQLNGQNHEIRLTVLKVKSC